MLEFGADTRLDLSERGGRKGRKTGGLVLSYWVGEMDRGGAVGEVRKEGVDGGDDALGVEVPFDKETIGGEATVEGAAGDTVEIGNEMAGDGAESVEIEMGVASLERVEGPFDETNAARERFVALEEF